MPVSKASTTVTDAGAVLAVKKHRKYVVVQWQSGSPVWIIESDDSAAEVGKCIELGPTFRTWIFGPADDKGAVVDRIHAICDTGLSGVVSVLDKS